MNLKDTSKACCRGAGGKSHHAFTLIELLVVIAVIGLLIAMTVPYMFGAIAATKLTAGGDQIVGMFSNAQQTASATGSNVELRFYQNEGEFSSSKPTYRTIVQLRYYQQGEPNPDPNPANTGKPLDAPMAVVLGEALTLSQDVVITENPDASTLIANLPNGSASIPAKIQKEGALVDYVGPSSNATFKSFLFRPESTNLNSSRKWFLTVISSNDEESGAAPNEWANFYTVQIDPGTGRITSYRP